MSLPSSPPELSERELEILRLVATGASNKEIATRLVISPNTVKVHLRNVFAKIGAASRTEAAMYAMRAGLVESVAPVPAIEEAAPADDPGGALAGVPAAEVIAEPVPLPRRLLGNWLVLAGILFLAALLLGGAFLLGQGGRTPPQPTPNPTEFALALPSRWADQPHLPEARRAMAVAAFDNSLYVSGGETSAGISGSLLRWRPGQNTWESLAAKPTPVSEVQAARLGERIFIPGGKGSAGQPLAVVEAYNLRQNRWESVAPLPQPRSGYALAAVEGRLYLFGGWDGKQYTATVFMYDPAVDTWQSRSPLPAPRGLAGAAAMQESYILVVGGTDGARALDSLLSYTPQRDIPGENPWEERTPLPEARSAAGVTMLADQVYVIGGEGNGKPAGSLPPVQFQPLTNRWSAFETPPAAVGLMPALIPLETRLYVFGGQSSAGLTAEHQSYQALYTAIFPIQQK